MASSILDLRHPDSLNIPHLADGQLDLQQHYTVCAKSTRIAAKELLSADAQSVWAAPKLHHLSLPYDARLPHMETSQTEDVSERMG